MVVVMKSMSILTQRKRGKQPTVAGKKQTHSMQKKASAPITDNDNANDRNRSSQALGTGVVRVSTAVHFWGQF